MNGSYVGYVTGDDPLHDFLSRILRDRMGVCEPQPAFRVFRLSGSNEVYAYEEKFSGAKVICKFYGTRFGWDRDKAAWTARQEDEGLETLRRYNLVGSPHHVIRPLGVSGDINAVLAVEYFSGEEFSHAIRRATQHGDDAHLYWRLKALAYFLATQHNRTANGASVDFDSECRYFDKVVGRLKDGDRIGQWDVDELSWLRDCWRDRPQMWQDRQVWLHGDATPANFLFGHGMDVAAIDLERMKRGDRMFDVGRVAGELQHAFMAAVGDWRRAEPFIGHFLWEYSCHFPDRERTFESITARAPYYMG
jgi:aminoglycoside phosphotransferase (APT) family kinase protein